MKLRRLCSFTVLGPPQVAAVSVDQTLLANETNYMRQYGRSSMIEFLTTSTVRHRPECRTLEALAESRAISISVPLLACRGATGRVDQARCGSRGRRRLSSSVEHVARHSVGRRRNGRGSDGSAAGRTAGDHRFDNIARSVFQKLIQLGRPRSSLTIGASLLENIIGSITRREM